MWFCFRIWLHEDKYVSASMSASIVGNCNSELTYNVNYIE